MKVLELIQNEDESAFELVAVAVKVKEEKMEKGAGEVERKDKERRRKVPTVVQSKKWLRSKKWTWRSGGFCEWARPFS